MLIAEYSFCTHIFGNMPEIRLVESPARLPVIVLCWYAITNQHQIGGTRYVFEGMCHELLYLYI